MRNKDQIQKAENENDLKRKFDKLALRIKDSKGDIEQYSREAEPLIDELVSRYKDIYDLVQELELKPQILIDLTKEQSEILQDSCKDLLKGLRQVNDSATSAQISVSALGKRLFPKYFEVFRKLQTEIKILEDRVLQSYDRALPYMLRVNRDEPIVSVIEKYGYIKGGRFYYHGSKEALVTALRKLFNGFTIPFGRNNSAKWYALEKRMFESNLIDHDWSWRTLEKPYNDLTIHEDCPMLIAELQLLFDNYSWK